MCGISGIFGVGWTRQQLETMVQSQNHRGPDANGVYIAKTGVAGLGHNRLSILDLSEAGNQPMNSADGRYWIVFNGEIYNYIELRAELTEFEYHSQTDTEVILAAYVQWGKECLDRLIGMFSFIIWDDQEQSLFAVRDRFGVKPLHYHMDRNGCLFISSEIKGIHAAGVPATMNTTTWATYLLKGLYDHDANTFWENIYKLPQGHWLEWKQNKLKISEWYNLAQRVGTGLDTRSSEDVKHSYQSLLHESVALRFRSDVQIGINLSGGLDSSILLGMVQSVQGADSNIKIFSFLTGDPIYDEIPWVKAMIAHTKHSLIECELTPSAVPKLAKSVQQSQDEPFGGLPTLAYANLFEVAHGHGVIVLLDGQGMDEQWAGYDYYLNYASDGTKTVQGTKSSINKPECLAPDFSAQAMGADFPLSFYDIRDMQYRDIRYTKIPRALRFNDRISMRSSTELREPFLDHRLVELAFRQTLSRKIHRGINKWLLRQMAAKILPLSVAQAPKRPIQTPQREWLRGPLKEWAGDYIQMAVSHYPEWLQKNQVESAWQNYYKGESDNSFYIWQWVNLGLISEVQKVK